MRNKKKIRTCKGCRLKTDKSDFFRIYYDDKESSLKIGDPSNSYGRGMYICKNSKCLDKLLKKGIILKELKIQDKINAEDIKEDIEKIKKEVHTKGIYGKN